MINIFTPRLKITVDGLNQSRFLSETAKAGILIKKVVKLSEKSMTFIIKRFDCEKVFAITDKMCYNVTKVAPIGFYALTVSAVKNLGITLGILAFILLSPLSNFVVSDIVI